MKKNSILKLLFLCCLIAHSSLSAQKRRTVVVDSSNALGTDYRFSPLFYTPPTISHEGVKLNLEVSTNALKDGQLRVLKFANQNDTKKSIGTIQIAQQDASLAIPLNISQDLQRINTPLSIKGQFTESAQGIVEFNSSDTSSQSYNINKTPRLVVDYELSKEHYGAAWSQLNGNAQHSNQIDWTFGNFIAPISEIRNFQVAGFNDNNNLLTYKNKAIIFDKDEAFALSGIHQSMILWRLRLVSLPAKKPVITPDGKMIYLSNNNTLEVLELNEGKHIASKALSDIKITIKKGETDTINKLSNDMTLGYDGTLYMPIADTTGNFGIIALSAYPQLMPRWFYNTTNSVGPVSLSRNEKMVFFIETDRKNAKSRLVVLDNANGAVLTQSDDILGLYTNDREAYIPPVVVQNSDKDTSVVYVLDGYKTSNKLFIFKVHHDQFYDEDGNKKNTISLAPFRLKELSNARNEGISHPAVLDNENVLMVYEGKLQKYNYKNDIFEERRGISVNNSEATILTSNDASYGVVLTPNTLYMIDLTTNPSKILDFKMVSGWLNAVLNPDFSTYVRLNNGGIRQFFPLKSRDNQMQVNLNEVKNKCSYLYNGAIIASPITVTENTQAIVQGTTISLPRGFQVQKGASLTFQIVKP